MRATKQQVEAPDHDEDSAHTADRDKLTGPAGFLMATYPNRCGAFSEGIGQFWGGVIEDAGDDLELLAEVAAYVGWIRGGNLDSGEYFARRFTERAGESVADIHRGQAVAQTAAKRNGKRATRRVA